MLKFLTVLIFFSVTYITTATFRYGQPCSNRNTAFLFSTNWTIPANQINCVDITGYETPNRVNKTAFFQLVGKADTLYADHMNLSRFPSLIIYTLRQLETIDLSGNAIKRTPYKLYKVAPRVSKLLLAENQIFVPRKRPLFKSASVKMLMLSRNRITNIYPITFAKMPALEILYLDGNRLMHIDPDMFLPIPNLKFLHLGQNVLTKFPPKDLMPRLLRFYITSHQRRIM